MSLYTIDNNLNYDTLAQHDTLHQSQSIVTLRQVTPSFRDYNLLTSNKRAFVGKVAKVC